MKRPIRAGSPTCCFKSLTRSARVALSAGPRLNSSVARRQNKNVTVSTAASGERSTMNEKFTLLSKAASEWSRRLLHQTLRMSPTSPPQIARKRPSQSNCLIIRQRDAPSAMRKAISFERAVPRASNIFARFRHAMSRTAPAIAISNVPINVTGPSFSGDVLRLKRDGF